MTQADNKNSQNGNNGPASTIKDRVQAIINQLRPFIQSDGGDLELVDVTPEGLVKVRLHGACVGCPSSSITLKMGVERHLREKVPEVTGVESLPVEEEAC